MLNYNSMNKLGGIKMKNNKVRSKKREYDTYSITMGVREAFTLRRRTRRNL